MKKPFISITVPAYKAQYLAECIDSILAQTYSNFELVIVNDASPQNLDEIVGRYHDDRIRYFKNEKNCGALHVVDNWNKCLAYAKGDYVICMGDDDKLLPNCLEEYVRLIEKYPQVDVLHGWTEIIDEKSEIYDINSPRPEVESVYSLMYYRLAGRQQYIGDFIFKVSTLRKNGGYYFLPMAWGSDDISAYIAAKSFGVVNTQKPIFLYRRSRITLSSSGNMTTQMEGIIKNVEWINNFLDTSTASNDIDMLYKHKIREILPEYIEQRKTSTIIKDCRNKGFVRLLYWITKKRKYNISSKTFVKAIIRIIKG